jgi:replicative DNA helicase
MSFNAEAYARIVEDNAVRRRVIEACNKAAQAAYNSELLEQVQEAAGLVPDAVYREGDSDNVFGSGLSAVYDRAGENAERTAQGKPIDVGLTTGFIDLDRILLGLEAEESVLVAGRPGTGKTAFILNVASFAALTLRKKVAIFSQEMSAEEIARRMVSSYAEIDSQRIKTGALQDHEWSIFTNAIDYLQGSGLYVSDASNLTPAKLRSKCLQLQKTQGLDVVFVDYIQLMSAGTRTENRTREVGYISQHIKMLARELKAPIISACQLSRKSEDRADKRPTLSDLRDSGDLEQDANTVLFLYRPEVENKQNVTEVIVAKRRDGQIGSAELIYRAPITKFVNAETKVFRINEE